MYLRQASQHEEIEKQRLEFHRQQHQARLGRIMDERNRQIGMDVDYLKMQIEEKKAREAAEKAEEQDYQRRFLEEQRLLGRLARQERLVRAQIAQEDNIFRKEHQRREDTREWDITRPDYKKVQLPVRQGDDDPWLSVSGGQKFEGEDLNCQDRQRRQREQLKKWQTQQIMEMENRRALEIAEDKEWQRRYLENDKLMQQIEEQTKLARKEVQQRQDDENYRAMMERKRQIAEEKQQELEDNEWEKMQTINSPFMTESREQAVGRGGKRIVQDWKGFTEQETQKVREEREQQAAADAQRKRDEAEREKREEAERRKATREALRRQRAEDRERKQREYERAQENLRQAQEHKQREQIMNKDVYGTNQPQEEFWNYFGKSHR